jgi:hypothetical protein
MTLTCDVQFEARLPARKFRKYVCVGRVGEGAGSASGSDEKEAAEVVHEELAKV